MSKELYTTKIFYCSCLGFYVNEILNADVRGYKEILNTILFDETAPEHVLSTRLEKNTRGVIVCLVHLDQFLVTKTKCFCAAESGFWFDELNRGYCFSCVKHYLKKMAGLFKYKVFNNECFFSPGVCFYCLFVSSFLTEKCSKNSSYVIAFCKLIMNANFGQFKGMCLQHFDK